MHRDRNRDSELLWLKLSLIRSWILFLLRDRNLSKEIKQETCINHANDKMRWNITTINRYTIKKSKKRKNKVSSNSKERNLRREWNKKQENQLIFPLLATITLLKMWLFCNRKSKRILQNKPQVSLYLLKIKKLKNMRLYCLNGNQSRIINKNWTDKNLPKEEGKL